MCQNCGNQIVFQYFPVFRHKPGIPAVGLDFTGGDQSIRGNIEFYLFISIGSAGVGESYFCPVGPGVIKPGGQGGLGGEFVKDSRYQGEKKLVFNDIIF